MNKHLHREEAKLLFEDTNKKDKLVSSRHLPSQSINNRVNYHKIANDYVPDRYQFVSHDQLNSSVVKPGNSYIIYVKSIANRHDGEIIIRYNLHGDLSHVITQHAIHKPIGHRFNFKNYIKNAPSGYRIDSIMHGKQITQFTDHRQYLDLSVLPSHDISKKNVDKKNSHKKTKPAQITDGLLYQNADNGNIEGTAVIHGPRGMKIDYKPYIHKGSKYMPKGYQFYHLFTNTKHTLMPNMSYTILVKPVEVKQHSNAAVKSNHLSNSSVTSKNNSVKSRQPKEIHGMMEYYDAKTNKSVKSVAIKGLQGHPVDYSNYMMSNKLPDHYHLVGLGVHASNYFKPQAHYIILVEADHVVPKSQPTSPRMVNEVVNYRDAKTDQLIDSQNINGPKGLSIDYKQYVPKGYRFVKLSHDSKAQLNDNAHCDVLVLPKVSRQSNFSKKSNVSRPSSIENNSRSEHSSQFESNQSSSKASVSDSKYSTGISHMNSKTIPRPHISNPQKPNPKMPSIGGTNKAANIGMILENLGKSLSALGHAIRHHQI